MEALTSWDLAGKSPKARSYAAMLHLKEQPFASQVGLGESTIDSGSGFGKLDSFHSDSTV